ncbi:hypothetical protein [Paraburkholderia haematera]|uniref:hypothetical protein n=1 Tax=Paraburkholderia haematera TaxID=2793077 RepID=UPI001B8D8361|nr:hypothetical protein [Paraburkholderia haematera]
MADKKVQYRQGEEDSEKRSPLPTAYARRQHGGRRYVRIVECPASKPRAVFHAPAPVATEQFLNADYPSGHFPSWNPTLSERLTPPIVAQNKKTGF